MTIRIIATGGTFDKVYFDALSEFRIGDPMAGPDAFDTEMDLLKRLEP